MRNQIRRHMISWIFRILSYFAFVAATSADEQDLYEDVANRVALAVLELREQRVGKGMLEIPPLASKHLESFTDDQRIRGIDVWMRRQQQGARAHAPAEVGDLLTNDPGMIADSSELGRLLASVNDPERFFLLASFSDYFSSRGDTFIPETARMLFVKGRILPQTNNSAYSDVLFDMSAFTYSNILSKLNLKSVVFDEVKMFPSETQISHGEKALVLGKWLRANWPGCENLVIPSGLRNEMDSSGNMLKHSRAQARERTRRDLPSGSSKIGGTNNLLTVLAIFVSLTLTWFCLRRLMAAK